MYESIYSIMWYKHMDRNIRIIKWLIISIKIAIVK